MGFCSNCGAQIPDGAATCPACGTAQNAQVNSTVQQPVYGQPQYNQPVNNQPAYGQPAYGQAEKGPKGPNPIVKAWKDAEAKYGMDKLFKYCVIIVTVLLMIIIASSANAYKKPVKAYINGFKSYNANKVYRSLDKKLVDEADIDKDDLKDAMEDLEDDDWKIKSYKIVAVVKADKEAIDDIEDYMDSFFDYEPKIKKAYLVVVHLVVDDDGDDREYDVQLTSYKTRGKWFIMPSSLD